MWNDRKILKQIEDEGIKPKAKVFGGKKEEGEPEATKAFKVDTTGLTEEEVKVIGEAVEPELLKMIEGDDAFDETIDVIKALHAEYEKQVGDGDDERMDRMEVELFGVLAEGMEQAAQKAGKKDMLETMIALQHAVGRLMGEAFMSLMLRAIDGDKLGKGRSDEEATKLLRIVAEAGSTAFHNIGCELAKEGHNVFHRSLQHAVEMVAIGSEGSKMSDSHMELPSRKVRPVVSKPKKKMLH